jgi:hypothetical protein
MEELQISPDARKIVIAPGGGCPRLDFSFFAEDPDVTDTLTVRWYVDYPVAGSIDPDLRLPPNGKTIRDQATLTIDLGRQLNIPAGYLQQSGTHVVEALLFDYALGAQRRPLPIDPGTDGGIPNPSYVVSYAWVVECQACVCP